MRAPQLPVVGRVRLVRLLATASVALVVGAYLQVLHFIVTVTGDPSTLTVIVVGSVAAGALLAGLLRPRWALLLGIAALVAGAVAYVTTLPEEVELYGALGPLVADSVSLLSGLSILRIVNADVWAMGVAPGPTFLATYLAVRRHYLAAAGVAGATLGVFVLTGDAGLAITLLGAVGVVGAMGFGDADAPAAPTGGAVGGGARVDGPVDGGTAGSVGGREAADADVDLGRRGVLERLAALVLVSLSVNVVPSEGRGGGGGGLGGLTGGDGTLEASLVRTGDQLDIAGSIELSPSVRFAVEADREGYWRVGSFDRFTGSGWVRTGGSKPYDGRLDPPPGDYRRVEQTVEFEDSVDTMPARWKPVEIEQSDTSADVIQGGSVRPVRAFTAGESFTVTSEVPVASARQLRAAGTEYPELVAERYTPLPENTPDRVVQRTDRITANADNAYDTARVIEQWLRNNRGYSLDVDKPSGNVADAFLFEMREGYCTYFATTMVTMLRTQAIPARFTVGYTRGERVARDRWVVRGLNAHAWVEAYFPAHGWIRFDPTPAGPREDVRTGRVQAAREADESDVDTAETGPEEWTTTPEPGADEPEPPDQEARTPDIEDQPGANTGGGGTPTRLGRPGADPDDDGGMGIPDLPSREQLGLGLVVAVGAAAGLRRAGVGDRAYREVWLRVQPREAPATDARRAYERAEYVVAERERPRRAGETVRQYADAVGDDRLRTLATYYERATYGVGVDRATADDAVAIADDVVDERSLLPRRGR